MKPELKHTSFNKRVRQKKKVSKYDKRSKEYQDLKKKHLEQVQEVKRENYLCRRFIKP